LDQNGVEEYAAVYAARVTTEPDLVANDELTRFLWWVPDGELLHSMSPLDAEIARRCRSVA
jgi:hypothetical protein